MANNNKKTKKATPASTKLTNNNTNNGTRPRRAQQQQQPPAAATPLTQAQLVILILLCMGISRLLQIRNITNDTKVCSTILTTGCSDNNNNTALMIVKFHTGLHTAGLVLAVMLQCWNSNAVLEQFNGLLCFCPLLIIGIVLFRLGYKMNVVTDAALRQQAYVGMVLVALTIPLSREKLPFCNKRFYKKASLQSLLCISLSAFYAIQVARWIWMGWPGSQETLVESWNSKVIPKFLVQTSQDAVGPLIMALICVDWATRAFLYAFAWYHFPEGHQRSFFLSVAALHVMEYMFQIPILQDKLQDGESLAFMSLSFAVFCGFGWIAPSLAWKSKLN